MYISDHLTPRGQSVQMAPVIDWTKYKHLRLCNEQQNEKEQNNIIKYDCAE